MRMRILFGKERSNHHKSMDMAGLLPPIYEDVLYEEEDDIQHETCTTTMLQAMTAKEKRQVSLEEGKNQKYSNGSELLPITEEESNDSEQNEGFEGNTSFDENRTVFSLENNTPNIELLNRPGLEVIHEATVFDDNVSQLRYFINDEGSSSGKSPPQTAMETGNSPLVRHWVNLCTENFQQKRELDMELMGYSGNAGVTWGECANKRLHQLQKEQIRLEQEIQKESQFFSVVPGGYKLVQDLRDQLRNIYRKSIPCYLDQNTVNDGWRMEEQVPEQKVHIPFEPTDLEQTVHENRLEMRKEKTKNKNTSHQIVQEEYSLFGNNANKTKTCHGRRHGHDDEKREATLKGGNKKCLNEPKPRTNVVNNGHAMLHLPPIQMNSKQMLARSSSPQMSKSVCGLPDIHGAKKMSITEETISSASESSQVSSRKAPPLRPLNQKLPEIKSANRNTAPSMANQARAATSTQIMPNILSPLVSIPKSSKEIRNFFQAPKRKSMSKKLKVSNAHQYDILIIEHNNQEGNLSANCVPQTKANGALSPLKKVTSEPQRRCSEVKVAKNERPDLSKKSKKADKISTGRRNGQH